MSELHLDLCRQSTKQLHDTIASLKENLKILDIFVTSGLSSEDGKSKEGSSVALTSAEGSQPDEGERHQQQDKDEKRLLQRFDRHQHCCCMCPVRLGRVFCNSGHYHGGARCTANSGVASPRRSRPVFMPRLNRTASLRRDTAVEKVSRLNVKL